MALALTEKICNLLIENGIVSQEDLEKAKKTSLEKGENLSDMLIKMNMVTKNDLLTVLSEELGFPPIKLSLFHIDDATLKLIPKKITVTYQMLPVSQIGKQLTVAMVDPLNIFALDDLKTVTHLNINPVIAEESDMKEAISRYYEKSANEEINAIVSDIKSAQMEMVTEGRDELSSTDLLKITEEAPVVKLTNMVLGRAVKERASDVMVEPMEGDSRVRYRVDGVLFESYAPPKKFHQALVSRIKVMADLDIAERRKPQDGRFRIRIEGRNVDFRVSVVPSSLGEKVALRVLDKAQAMIDLDRLGFQDSDVEKMKEISALPHGMILVCGPTGCGKTTTLYSILKHIDDPGKNLITVEDPVEYELQGIGQVSINEEIGLTFAGCLRSILRQDPDIIMVGEIRDFDTIDVAIKSALTGHLVLSTLHTNTAAGSIVRMINMGVEPFLIAASVELVAAQRLLRKLCIACREAYTPDKETAERYGLFDEKGKIARIYRPKGCARCRNSGYSGRIGIVECMRLTPRVKELIFKQAQGREIEEAAMDEGMTNLRENGMKNVIAGRASLEDVLCSTIGSSEEEE
ncbi:MAG: Flp pilus assembly complex ATPase component TadA [Candidatus Omnitrophica bacterium]|nr:Flp pilus assembly complex ATPase component TadA [Candidatus Omnitrophota bacterium]